MYPSNLFFRKRFLLFILFLIYISLIVYIFYILKFDMFRSDILGYWNDSLNWKIPFNGWHVPGYPLVIALFRLITLNLLPPLILMMVINIISFVTCGYLIFKIIIYSGNTEILAIYGVLLFSLWPFTGLLYSVYPLGDTPAMAVFLLAIFLIILNHRKSGYFVLGISILFQKILWPFVFCYVLIDIFTNKNKISIRNWLTYFTLVSSPLLLLLISGAIYYNDLLWMVSNHVATDVSFGFQIPVIGTIVGVFQQGGLPGLVKGTLIAAIAIISLSAIGISIFKKQKNYITGISISVAVLICIAIVTPREAWAVVRFGKLLTIPIIFSISSMVDLSNFIKIQKIFLPLILTVLAVSQFAYAYYMTIFFS